jgi:hypothetical protein
MMAGELRLRARNLQTGSASTYGDLTTVFIRCLAFTGI